MRKITHLIFTISICLISFLNFGQKSFSNCSAIFLNTKMLVNEYSPSGKCTIDITAKGDLTVSTIQLSSPENKPIEPILFQIAIKDKETGTLMLVSKEKLKKMEIQKVLEKCKKGDHIIILTLSDDYALPHNEILVL